VGDSSVDRDEPKVKSYFAIASREAVREVWGDEGVRAVSASLAPRVRDDVFAEPLPLWIAERSFIALHLAMYETVAERNREEYFRVLRKMTDKSFGVVRRFLVTIASPSRFLESAGSMWKADHTHGSLEGRCDANGRGGALVLRDSPFTETPHARRGIAENLRYVLELTGANGAVATHALVAPGVLEIKLRWA
jgi:hypothetical protein